MFSTIQVGCENLKMFRHNIVCGHGTQFTFIKEQYVDRNETSLVSLKLLENDKRVQEVYYSRPYTLRADISRPDGEFSLDTVT